MNPPTTTTKQRDVLVKARWAGKEVTLRSIDDGKTFVTSTGETGRA